MIRLLNLLILLACSSTAFAAIIPDDRRVQWTGNMGVPGGITNRTTIFCNVLVSIPGTNRVAVGDDATDDRIAIQTALNLCPGEQVVYIPTATYKVSGTLIVKTNCTVRGDGIGKTIIDSFCTGNAGTGSETFALGINGIGNQEQYKFGTPGTPQNITSGTGLGSSNIVVASATGFSVGKFVCIDVWDDTNGFIGVSDIGNEGHQNIGERVDGKCLSQISYITAVSGTTITIDPPLLWYYTNGPQATPFPCKNKFAGIEDLTVNDNNTGADYCFSLQSCYGCWVKNCESEWSDGDHVVFDSNCRCELRHSYIHDSYVHTAGGHDSCVMMKDHATGILIEDNIIRRCHVGMMIEGGGGGCVFGYNFITNQFDSGNNIVMFADITHHGAHVLMTLAEGNVMNNYQQDGVWGTSSHGTLLRNYISGSDYVNPPYTGRSAETTPVVKQYAYNWAVQLAGAANSRFFNVIGNVLGYYDMGHTPGSQPQFMAVWPATRPNPSNNGLVWSLGYGGGSDTGGGTGDNADPLNYLINHGNWDVVSGGIQYSNNIADHVIPQSYYLIGKPSWFGNLTWPPVDPTLGTNWQSTPYLIPAQERFFTGQDPPTNVVASSLSLNSATLQMSGATMQISQ